MNCEGYVVYYEKDSFINIYPKNISSDIFGKMCACATDDDTLVIRRQGDMIYYLYLRRFVNEKDKWVGIAAGVNLVVIDELLVLHDFFCNEMRRLTRDYHIAYYDDTAGVYCPRRQEEADYDLGGAARRLAEAFNARFSHESTRPGSLDYTKQPGNDFMSIKADGKVVRFSTQESEYAQYSVRQSIERGNTVVATNERTFEQETASLRQQLKAALEKTNELQIQAGYQNTRIANLKQQLNTYRQGTKPAEETPTTKPGKTPAKSNDKFWKRFLWFYCIVITVVGICIIGIITHGNFGCSRAYHSCDSDTTDIYVEEDAVKVEEAPKEDWPVEGEEVVYADAIEDWCEACPEPK